MSDKTTTLRASATNSYPLSVRPTNINDVAPGSKVTVGFKFLSGLFNQDKYLPIRYCPITIYLELVNTYTDAIISIASDSQNPSLYSNITTSETWSINNVQLKCDVVSLDNTLDNQYTDHLLSGKALPKLRMCRSISAVHSLDSNQSSSIL